jgi:hypothetical protein
VPTKNIAEFSRNKTSFLQFGTGILVAYRAETALVALLLRKLTGQEFRHPETGVKMVYALA